MATTTLQLSPEVMLKMEKQLVDNNVPIAERYRILFTLRSIPGDKSREALSKGLLESSSALLRHEIAYVLGQRRETQAIKILTTVLENKKEDCMVRHEAAEALGAIADPSALDILEKYKSDSAVEVAETCIIAIDRIKYYQAHESTSHTSGAFNSVDPAPSFEEKQPIDELRKLYISKEQSLFLRYRAMFALRDLNSKESVEVLCEGFQDSSSLFRHEVAYVLGQMQNPAAKEALKKVAGDLKEHDMVRHEAAEALGALPDAEKDLALLLKSEQAQSNGVDVVKESCEVALDMSHHHNSDQFQYADGLSKTN